MSDLVERLRFSGRYAAETERECAIRKNAEREEAADEIERLRGRGVFGDDGVPRLLLPQLRAEIIEECAKVANPNHGHGIFGDYENGRRDAAEAIRALAAQEKEKTHEPG